MTATLNENTQFVSAAVTHPLLGVTMASQQLAGGRYRVTVSTIETGTPDATPLNVQLKNGASLLAKFSSLAVWSQRSINIEVADQSTLTLSAVADGGAAAVYNVEMACDLISEMIDSA